MIAYVYLCGSASNQRDRGGLFHLEHDQLAEDLSRHIGSRLKHIVTRNVRSLNREVASSITVAPVPSAFILNHFVLGRIRDSFAPACLAIDCEVIARAYVLPAAYIDEDDAVGRKILMKTGRHNYLARCSARPFT